MDLLLIDDDRDDLEIFIEALDAVGNNITYSTSTDSTAALQQLLFSNKLPDVVYVDINMPRMNGFESIKEVKNTGRLKDHDIVLISNPPRELVIAEINQYQKVRYLENPLPSPL